MYHPDEIETVAKNHNIYIHPKYPEKVKSQHRKYIIPKLVPTEWGKLSIVKATIELLREAYINTSNKWFILLSQDAYPMVSLKHIKSYLKDEKKSIFDYVEDNGTFYKTSQWWILHRKDVYTILNYHNEFNKKYKTQFSGVFKTTFESAVDEVYFLSLLKWNNPHYSYTKAKPVFTRWLDHISVGHPFVFNRLLDYDKQEIEKNHSLFLRKTTPHFNTNTYKTHDELYILFVGTETQLSQYSHLLTNPNVDIAIVSGIPMEEVDANLLKKSIWFVQIYYKLFHEAILEIVKHIYPRSSKIWKIIHFYTEKYNPRIDLGTTNDFNILPKQTFYFKKGKEIENNKKFFIQTDQMGNKAYTLII